MGYKYEDLIGKPAIKCIMYPAERKALNRYTKSQGFLQNYEVRVKKADGNAFPGPSRLCVL